MTDFKTLKGVKSLLFSRDSLKRKIITMLYIMLSRDSLKNFYFQKQQDLITKWMADINLANSEINEICEKADIDLENSG